MCWTDVPGTMGALRGQRIRWHTGLLDKLRIHKGMFGRPRFGAAGVFGMPCLVLFEALEPLVEILGLAIVITRVILHAENWTYVVAFFLIATLIGGRPGWSTIPRCATREQPTQAVAPLTR